VQHREDKSDVDSVPPQERCKLHDGQSNESEMASVVWNKFNSEHGSFADEFSTL
jgi:hypothetical protein